jgi:hypothetical protein
MTRSDEADRKSGERADGLAPDRLLRSQFICRATRYNLLSSRNIDLKPSGFRFARAIPTAKPEMQYPEVTALEFDATRKERRP